MTPSLSLRFWFECQILYWPVLPKGKDALKEGAVKVQPQIRKCKWKRKLPASVQEETNANRLKIKHGFIRKVFSKVCPRYVVEGVAFLS